MSIKEYHRKRDFRKTPEPSGKKKSPLAKDNIRMFVVQEHHASHLHYDFRLELNGVLKSWAVPKGPSMDPKTKRLAVEVEDHPLDYGSFQGTIPEGHYGAGKVYIWDTGTWTPIGSPRESLKKGHLEFELKGKRLRGRWMLLRTQRDSGKKHQWLLVKRSDDFAKAGDEVKPIAESKPVSRTKKKTRPQKKGRRPFPKFIEPELATLVKAPPEGEEWLHETKFDGYRTQAHINGSKRILYTRSGLDWSAKYPSIQKSLKDIDAANAILDGEIVWVDTDGRSDFQKLQEALKNKDTARIVYYVFDLLFLNGEDLREKPLRERKEILRDLLDSGINNIRFSDHIEGQGRKLLSAACSHHLEGIISKNGEAGYLSRRGDNWLKSKCHKHQEFVIGGFTLHEKSREGFSSLLLGVYEGKKLRYAGRVGTGFTQSSLETLAKKLNRLERNASPFDLKSPRGRGLHWIEPKLVAEITFANWTSDQVLRQAVFHGLREDKNPVEIHVENPKKAKTRSVKKTKKQNAEALALTNPEKIVFKKERITKQDLAEYYQKWAHLVLPHLADRPLNLLRCPDLAGKDCFFQKHMKEPFSDAFTPIEITEKSGRKTYVSLDSEKGLEELSQMRAFEIHAWGSRAGSVEYPDQIVMDLDPGEGVPWKTTVAAAFELKEMLEHLSLKSFVKLSGGKGLHVQIPIKPLYTWDQIKNFSQALAKEMERQSPDLYISTMSKSKRTKKIFVDYLRNGRGATAVIPYSVRMRDHSSVAMPVTWEELKRTKSSDQFDLKKASIYLARRKKDPWTGYFALKQKISILKPGIATRESVHDIRV